MSDLIGRIRRSLDRLGPGSVATVIGIGGLGHLAVQYARAMGFRSTILHGFAAMARTYAGLERRLGPRRLGLLDVRFRKPIVLPAQLSLYVNGDQVLVGTADEPVCLTGRFAWA